MSRVAFFGGDDDHPVTCFATVEGCGGGATEDGHRFDVVGVGVGGTVGALDRAEVVAGSAIRAVVEGHPVHYNECIAGGSDGAVTAEDDLCAAAETAGTLRNDDVGDLTVE